MPSFGETSQARLLTCHQKIQTVCNAAILFMDFSVLEGARPDELQAQYFLEGKSKLDGVIQRSTHQVDDENPLSRGIDLMPWPAVVHGRNIWSDFDRYRLFAGMFLGCAYTLDIPMRWGGDWDGDGSNADQSFHDLPHFELIE